MATGDQDDLFSRIKSVLPNGWFDDVTSILDALVQGIASNLSLMYGLIAYAKLQTRIKTATDVFLDLISADFFGTLLPRKSNELDEIFRARILANLLRERVTRNGMIKAITDLTGRAPIIFEPGRVADTGAYNTTSLAWGKAGAWGSLKLPAQAFITAYRPKGAGIPYVAGYGASTGAWNTPSREEYVNMSMIQGSVTDADIYETIDSVRAAGTTMWTKIQS